MCVTVAVPSALGLITTFGCSEEKPATEPADSAVDATAGDATSSDSSALDTNASDTIVADTSDDTCTCTTPPAATCADSVTRRTYALPGTCGDGGCSYASTDSPCPNGTLCKAGVCESPPSCSGGLTCISGDSCCSTLYVPGGSFNRSYDAVTPEYSDPKWKATISPFRLDKYEVTVGRFRKFVDAWAAGYRPAVGSGVHTHLRGGLGLVGESYTSWAGSVTDGGWIASYATKIPTSKAAFDTALNCDTIYGGVTWTPSAGTNETLPINCINWYEALAFCIWDGGFLPSEAEWNFAAAGGSEHRRYPWGSTAPTNLHAAYDCNVTDPTWTPSSTFGKCRAAPVGAFPLGNGKYGHADLAGNLREWMLDSGGNYDVVDGGEFWFGYATTSCNDCADLTLQASPDAPPPQVQRGVTSTAARLPSS